MLFLPDHVRLRLLVFAIGFAPIASLSLAAFDVVPLHISGPALVLPALAFALAIAWRTPRLGRQMLTGLGLGLGAVTLYDLTRLPFVVAGLWRDFIPKIGNYLFNTTDVHWSVGYAWRYLGNGGGMGMAFFVTLPLLRRRWALPRVGLVFGVSVYLCLLATLYLSPSGTQYLFEPTWLSATVGLIGHAVFGLALGYGAMLLLRPRGVPNVGANPGARPMTLGHRWRSWTRRDTSHPGLRVRDRASKRGRR